MPNHLQTATKMQIDHAFTGQVNSFKYFDKNMQL